MRTIQTLAFALSFFALTNASFAGEENTKKTASIQLKEPKSLGISNDAFDPGPIGNDPITDPVSANNRLNIKVQAYPNPSSNGLFKIKTDKEVNFTITDIMGKEISSGRTSDNEPIQIDLAQNQQGIYLLKLNSGGKFTTIRLMNGAKI